MTDFDIVVVGAGVVGLAVAQRLASSGYSVMVLEQEAWPGQHASSRNSEVIHAGIYYPPGSMKATLCRQGRDLLYDWCARYNVPHRRIGKLLVAVESTELPALQALHANAQANDVELQWLDATEVHALEPEVRAVRGLFSPLTGIVDSHALMQSYEAALQAAGGAVSCNAHVQSIRPIEQGLRLTGLSGGEAFELTSRWVVNAGGLFAQQVAHATTGYAPMTIPSIHLCKGSYFAYGGRSPFTHLVYPMPEANTSGLGVHATLDMGGQLRFGPDVSYQDSLDYQVDPALAESFGRAVQRYWPDCRPDKLVPGYAGIRAKLSGPGEPAADFSIQDQRQHGVAGMISLFGIESPGLTASLAIAAEVAMRIDSL
ncbi:MAG TPA: NAD(P)/FAD-dependent oxidoreductase [Pseudomonas xinjiangensis]|uniref:NAD(P)/FAD-dependent oxidoreductase n=2 Tax=root TaxID=1 RepID=A0A7V1FRK0_9GAMM|nr:NAD(P)/FAD-dependent oxidoreductase [Halopseudomonas xinjiangensis]HEC48412.1 NAD(P)/FAD-dependent oxidoreductase [Halopseudomonas xinjiangensis]